MLGKEDGIITLLKNNKFSKRALALLCREVVSEEKNLERLRGESSAGGTGGVLARGVEYSTAIRYMGTGSEERGPVLRF